MQSLINFILAIGGSALIWGAFMLVMYLLEKLSPPKYNRWEDH